MCAGHLLKVVIAETTMERRQQLQMPKAAKVPRLTDLKRHQKLPETNLQFCNHLQEFAVSRAKKVAIEATSMQPRCLETLTLCGESSSPTGRVCTR